MLTSIVKSLPCSALLTTAPKLKSAVPIGLIVWAVMSGVIKKAPKKMKKKVALIFGLTGQDGSYLADFLLKKNS